MIELRLSESEGDSLVRFYGSIVSYRFGRNLTTPVKLFQSRLKPSEGGYRVSLSPGEYRTIRSYLVNPPPTSVEEGEAFCREGAEILRKVFIWEV